MTIHYDNQKFKSIKELEEYIDKVGIVSVHPDLQEAFRSMTGSETLNLEDHNCVNPENSQKLQYYVVEKEDIPWYEAQKELVFTDRAHDWSKTVADRLWQESKDAEENDEFIEYHNVKSLIIEYNIHVSNYNRIGLGDLMRFDNEDLEPEAFENILINNANAI